MDFQLGFVLIVFDAVVAVSAVVVFVIAVVVVNKNIIVDVIGVSRCDSERNFW